MASILRDSVIDPAPVHLWDALRDVAAVHRRRLAYAVVKGARTGYHHASFEGRQDMR